MELDISPLSTQPRTEVPLVISNNSTRSVDLRLVEWPRELAEVNCPDSVGPGETAITGILEEITRFAPPGPNFRDLEDLDSLPYPALDLLDRPSFIPILTSRGCPLDCTYCASRQLQPVYRRRQPLAAAAELIYWQDRWGLADAAFYDDALLSGAFGDPGTL